MFKKTVFALAAASLSFAAAPAFAASPVEGTWATVSGNEQFKVESTLSVAASGDSYTVTIKDKPMAGPDGGPGFEVPAGEISDVSIDGGKFSFKRKIAFGDMEMVLAYSGTVDGDALTGEIATPQGAMQITGKRQ